MRLRRSEARFQDELALAHQRGLALEAVERLERRAQARDFGLLVFDHGFEVAHLAFEGDARRVAFRRRCPHGRERTLSIRKLAFQPLDLLRLQGGGGLSVRHGGLGPEVLSQPLLQPLDQRGLLARARPQRLDLGPQNQFALEAGIAVALGLALQGGRQLFDLLALLLGEDARLFERHLVTSRPARQLGDFAIPVEQQALGLGEARLDAGQPVGDGLLQNAPRVDVLVEFRLELGRRTLQRRDAGIPAVDLDELARPFELCLLECRFELVHADREFRTQPVPVRLDLRLADRQRLLDAPRGEPDGPRPERRPDQQAEKARDQKAQRHQHRGLDGYHQLVLGSPGLVGISLSLLSALPGDTSPGPTH